MNVLSYKTLLLCSSDHPIIFVILKTPMKESLHDHFAVNVSKMSTKNSRCLLRVELCHSFPKIVEFYI